MAKKTKKSSQKKTIVVEPVVDPDLEHAALLVESARANLSEAACNSYESQLEKVYKRLIALAQRIPQIEEREAVKKARQQAKIEKAAKRAEALKAKITKLKEQLAALEG